MLYSILRVIVRTALKIYFRKIDISGIEHLKPGQAQILASNHPSGFLEPLIMACFFPRDLYFLVRGDVFENRIARYFLEATHQIPIYRFKDGFSKLRNNAGSIEAASNILVKRKCLLIFVEGGTKSIKMLRPLQKGFVKLAAETIQKDSATSVEILPVGINFSDSTAYKSEVSIRISSPIAVTNEQIAPGGSDYPAYSSSLVQEVYNAMKKNIVHLDHAHYVYILEWALVVNRQKHNRMTGGVLNKDDVYLDSCITISNQINAMEEEDLGNLKKEVKQQKELLIKNNLKTGDLLKKQPSWIGTIALVLGFFPALLGCIIHLPPLYVSKMLAKKLAPSKEFFGTIRMVSSIVFLIVFYLCILVFCLMWHLPWYTVVGVVVTGIWADNYYAALKGYVLFPKPALMQLKKKNIEIFNTYFVST